MNTSTKASMLRAKDWIHIDIPYFGIAQAWQSTLHNAPQPFHAQFLNPAVPMTHENNHYGANTSVFQFPIITWRPQGCHQKCSRRKLELICTRNLGETTSSRSWEMTGAKYTRSSKHDVRKIHLHSTTRYAVISKSILGSMYYNNDNYK